jgi:hypothetical protein
MRYKTARCHKKKLLAPKEYYKFHPHNDGQGKYLKVDHESVTFFWHKNKNTCSPEPVSQLSLKGEDLFIYMMPMHRKGARLRLDFVVA